MSGEDKKNSFALCVIFDNLESVKMNDNEWWREEKSLLGGRGVRVWGV